MRLLLLFSMTVSLLLACGGGRSGDPLTVFAAASLTGAFRELGRMFEEANPGADVTFQFAATSTLRAQLEQGARADVFASADLPNMRRALEAGVVDGPPRTFAGNTLAIIVREGNDDLRGIRDLAAAGLRLVVAAPQVPLGAYTHEALRRIEEDPRYGPGIARGIADNVVSQALNARHAVSVVQIGEADAAIAYVTDALVAGGTALRAIPMGGGISPEITYPIAVVEAARSRGVAQRFLQFVTSQRGQRVLAAHGFGGPP